MRLTELMPDSDLPPVVAAGLDIVGLTADSREVRPGYLFAALAGSRTDGAKFIADAIDRGAAAILAIQGTTGIAGNVALLTDSNPRRRLALLAARFFDAQPQTVAAVTGTNGKTSVASFTRQLWQALGLPAASVGTLGVIAPGFEITLAQTTPDPVQLQRQLAALKQAGIDHLAIEASSHGLDQYRLDGVRVQAAAFTNLTRDHMDYHPTVEAYFDAKMRLFDAVMPAGGAAVVNADSDWYDAVARRCRERGHRLFSYGRQGRDLRIERLEPHPGGLLMQADLFGRKHSIDLPLVGDFQAGNVLCALGLVVACGTAAESAIGHLAALDGVPGRMQSVPVTPAGGAIYVDYAHTPDALETVLSALRPHTSGNLVVLFGCGGDRDRGKRPLMGAVAERLADRIYVTDDNPRSEDPASIRRSVLSACPRGIEIGDRAAAIQQAVHSLRTGDVLVLAGKGHEQGQIVGDVVRPFDDTAVARTAVAALRQG